jgi:Glycosyl hydrolase family 30 TIM-barrel domain
MPAGINGSETTPLMVGKESIDSSDGANGNNKGNNGNSIYVRYGVGVVILAGLVGVAVIFFGGSGSQSSSSLPPPPLMPSSSSASGSATFSDGGDGGDSSNGYTYPSSMKYRPFCMVYGKRVKFAGVIQTSMGNPSQQWSHIPCYAQPEKVRKWASSSSSSNAEDDEQMVNLNGYGAPDAILQVQLDRLAFPNRRPVIGFGSAFTEASSLNYQSLSEQGKERLMELLFGKTGLGYSVGRVHINSCDFSVESYSFDETDGDFDLKDFDTDVSHDAQPDGMIDMILRATKTFNEAWNLPSIDGSVGIGGGGDSDSSVYEGDFKLFASPWSPPKWMKNPSSKEDIKAGLKHASVMTGSTQPSCLREGTGKGSKYAKAWALYFSKFITACKSFLA